MVLNEELSELTEDELRNSLYNYLTNFFCCNVNYSKLAEDIIKIADAKDEINDDEKFKLFLEKTYERYETTQQRRQNNFSEMIKECLDDGESKKFNFLKTRNADYILEINLIESKDVKADNYY